MARGKGGPFFTLINHHVKASEYAFSLGDYENCMSHIDSVAKLLKVKLPTRPYTDARFTTVHGGNLWKKQRNWILRHRPAISQAVRNWMDVHSGARVEIMEDEDEE